MGTTIYLVIIFLSSDGSTEKQEIRWPQKDLVTCEKKAESAMVPGVYPMPVLRAYCE